MRGPRDYDEYDIDNSHFEHDDGDYEFEEFDEDDFDHMSDGELELAMEDL
jgi:hypothetical protein